MTVSPTRPPFIFYPFLVASFISASGTFMQVVAEGWLVAELSPHPMAAGIVGFVGGLPLLFLLFGGVIADRYRRRKVLLLTQFVLMSIAVCLAFLSHWEAVEIWHIAILAFCTGLASAISLPAAQSFLFEIVGPEAVSRAISLNAISLHLARLAGPVLAGTLITWAGSWACFGLNAASFVLVMLMVAFMPVVVAEKTKPQLTHSVWHSLLEGLRYVRRTPALFYPLCLVAVTTGLTMPHINLLPLYVKHYLHLGPEWLGWLWGVSAAGSILSNFVFARVGPSVERQWPGLLCLVIFLTAVSLFSLARASSIEMAFLSIFSLGAFLALTVVISQSIVQRRVNSQYRGRVLGIWGTCFQGMFPIGNFFVGGLAQMTAIPTAWAYSSILLILSVLFGATKILRRSGH